MAFNSEHLPGVGIIVRGKSLAAMTGTLICCAAAACTAELGTPLGGGTSPSSSTDGTGESSETPVGGGDGKVCGAPTEPETVRRLNTIELNNVALDLFGITGSPFSGMQGDPVGFKTIGPTLSSDVLFTEDYLNRIESLSETLADRSLSDSSCDVTTGGSACVSDLLLPTVRLMFRAPVSEEFQQSLAATFDGIASTESLTPRDGLIAAWMNVWASPHFLFTKEESGTSESRPLTSYELAERLALTLWSSTPDEALLDAAATESLLNSDGLHRQIERMLADPRAGRFMETFAEQWLALDSIGAGRVDALALGLDEANWVQVVEDMKTETRLFVRHVFENDLPVSELVTARYSLLSESLATFYGTTRAPGGEFTVTEFSGESSRQGILAHGSILLQGASGTHPEIVKRGATVLNRFLCRPPPSPPAAVAEEVELQLASGASERERMEERASIPACAGCHQELDPLGYSFHGFDAAGRERTVDEHGEPIDATVTYQGVTFSETADILEFIAQEDVTSCVAQHLLTYAVGRNFDIYASDEDACVVEGVIERMEGDTLADLVQAVLTGPRFLTRIVSQ